MANRDTSQDAADKPAVESPDDVVALALRIVEAESRAWNDSRPRHAAMAAEARRRESDPP